MAKLVVKEIYEGTNEQMEELQNRISEIVHNECYKQNVGDTLMEVYTEVEFDEEDEEEQEEKLSERLSRELELLRPVLSRKAIKQAQALIAQAREDEEEDEEQDSYFTEDEMTSGDCDDDYEGLVIRVAIL